MQLRDKPKTGGYKWIIAVICFITVMIALGFGSGLKGVYLKTVSEALEIPRGAYSVSEILRYLATAGLNLFFGRLIGKLRAKRMMLLGVAFLILSVLCSSAAQNVWLVYAGGLFLGMGLAWCGAWAAQSCSTISARFQTRGSPATAA